MPIDQSASRWHAVRRAGNVALGLVGVMLSGAAVGEARQPQILHSGHGAPRPLKQRLIVPVPAVTGHAGRWLTDAGGQVVIQHGLNLSSKGADTRTPVATPEGVGFTVADAALMANSGFDSIRLTFQRSQWEPSPGIFNDAYAKQFISEIQLLWRRGIYSLVDFHQDEWGPTFDADGFPAWETSTGGLPNLDSEPFPDQYVANPALQHAENDFWVNAEDPAGYGPLQDDDAAALQRAVGQFQGVKGILGFEIINEPSAGSNYADECLNLATGCPAFDQTELGPYYARVIAAVRRVNPTALIFYEPEVAFDFGAPTHLLPPKDPNLVFSYHDYCLQGTSAYQELTLPPADSQVIKTSCTTADQDVESNAASQAAATGNGLYMTEWGAVTDLTDLDFLLTLYDANMDPWMYWSFNGLLGSNYEALPGGPPTLTTADAAAWNTLARPYPQLISGTPTDWSFDQSTNTFRLTYSTTRAGTTRAFKAGSLTQIFVPQHDYPTGYTVAVTGASVKSPSASPWVEVAAASGSATVSVSITPRNDGQTLLPKAYAYKPQLTPTRLVSGRP